MTALILFILVLCGMATNLVSALFGIGGGVLMVPILRTLFPELPLQVVAATSLTIVMCTSAINLFSFRKQKVAIDLKSMLLWSLGMIVGVQVGFELSFLFSSLIVSLIFTVSLSLLAIKTLLNRQKIESDQPVTLKERLKGSVFCAAGGLVAGITGIGGGSILAPLVGQLSSVKTKQIAVYTNYMMIIGGLGNLYGYLTRPLHTSLELNGQLGYVNFLIVGVVTAGSLLMSGCSMRLRGVISPERTRLYLAIILLLIALYMCLLEFNKSLF
ncbi:hypothetical protein A4G20_00870 [Pasteurellaceae bacterium RH1A]|nr:hypothetical protein A4G20_00870 [Pasteurellaceae bacterium RH1A]